MFRILVLVLVAPLTFIPPHRVAAEEVPSTQQARLAEVLSALDRNRSDLSARKHDDSSRDRLESEQARLLEKAATLYQESNNWNSAEKMLRELHEFQANRLGEQHWETTDARLAVASLRQRASLSSQQRAAIKEGTELIKKGSELHRKGRYADAFESLNAGYEFLEANLGQEHPDVIFALANIGVAYVSRHNYAKAEPIIRKAVRIERDVFGRNHPVYAGSLNDLAEICRATGRYREAEALSLQALHAFELSLGEQNERYANTLNTLGTVYANMGNYSRAAQCYEKALKIWGETIGIEHIYYAVGLNQLAGIHQIQGRYPKAELLYRRALESIRETHGERHPYYTMTLVNLAKPLVSTADYSRALAVLEEAIATNNSSAGNILAYGMALNSSGVIHMELGNHEEAQRSFEKAMTLVERALGKEHDDWLTIAGNLGLAHVKTGRHERAIEQFEAVLQAFESHPSLDPASLAQTLSYCVLAVSVKKRKREPSGRIRRQAGEKRAADQAASPCWSSWAR